MNGYTALDNEDREEANYMPLSSFAAVNASLRSITINNSQISLDDIVRDVHVNTRDHARPLSADTVQERLKKYGKNIPVKRIPVYWYHILGQSFFHPFNLILLALALISFIAEDISTAAVMVVMVTLGTGIRFVQEWRSETASQSLMELGRDLTAVIREKSLSNTSVTQLLDARYGTEGAEFLISAEDLVPGDLVVLRPGGFVPADLLLLESTDLFISQAALTGESVPVGKFVSRNRDPLPTDSSCLDANDVLFMGTQVTSGSGIGIVFRTAKDTFFASISADALAQKSSTTFQKGIVQISYMFIGIMLVSVPIIFLVTGIMHHDFLGALAFAISIAVGLTPELLPAIVNANLARGAVEMTKKNSIIVRRLDSLISIGGMNILCTDKTGTLTENKVTMMKSIDCSEEGFHEITGSTAVYFGYLNAYHQTNKTSSIDNAIVKFYISRIADDRHHLWTPLSELQFDFERRLLSVCIRNTITSECILVSKGALEEVLKACSMFRTNSKEMDMEIMERQQKDKILDYANTLQADGLRVIGVAIKQMPHSFASGTTLTKSYESEMVFIGLLTFLDKPKRTAEDAVSQLNKLGVEVKIMTGDTAIITEKVASLLSLENKGTVLGSDIDLMDDHQLAHVAINSTIFAKLTPIHKKRLVKVLKDSSGQNNTVGFLGDGINDAPALRESDIGISVESAASIAKETSDMIMVRNDLLFIPAAVTEGRVTFINTLKYLKMSIASNFGNVFSMVVASVWIPFIPLMPIQIVLQNMIYDVGQMSIPWDNVDDITILMPRTWDVRDILRYMVHLGPLSSVFDIISFGIMLKSFRWDIAEHAAFFRSGWFLICIFSQQSVFHVIRTRSIPFLRNLASWPVMLSSALVYLFSLVIILSNPIANAFSLTALGQVSDYWVLFVLIVLGNCISAEIMKKFYIWRYNAWI